MLKFALVVLLLAVAIYVGIRMLQGDIPGRGGGGGGVRRPRPDPRPGPMPRPMAPDDDPEFLRELDRRRRQRRSQGETDD